MLTAFLSRCLVLIFGTIYPAYRSYKAIKHRDMQEYLNCLRYWIVFACFVVVETVCDMFISWIPFYYEIKIIIVLCLLLPPGSTVVYKNFVQPTIRVHEADIDRFLEKTRTGGYNAVVSVGSSLLKYSSDMFINTAMRGSSLLGNTLARSASTNNIYPHSTTNDVNSDRRAKPCYQLSSTIGASGNYIWQDATALVRHIGQEYLNFDNPSSDRISEPFSEDNEYREYEETEDTECLTMEAPRRSLARQRIRPIKSKPTKVSKHQQMMRNADLNDEMAGDDNSNYNRSVYITNTHRKTLASSYGTLTRSRLKALKEDQRSSLSSVDVLQ